LAGDCGGHGTHAAKDNSAAPDSNVRAAATAAAPVIPDRGAVLGAADRPGVAPDGTWGKEPAGTTEPVVIGMAEQVARGGEMLIHPTMLTYSASDPTQCPVGQPSARKSIVSRPPRPCGDTADRRYEPGIHSYICIVASRDRRRGGPRRAA